MEKWSIIIASTVVDYFNQGLSTSGNAEYKRHHALSEAVGFMIGLSIISTEVIQNSTALYIFECRASVGYVGMNTNFYTLTDEDLEEAIGHIKMAFPSGEIK